MDLMDPDLVGLSQAYSSCAKTMDYPPRASGINGVMDYGEGGGMRMYEDIDTLIVSPISPSPTLSSPVVPVLA